MIKNLLLVLCCFFTLGLSAYTDLDDNILHPESISPYISNELIKLDERKSINIPILMYHHILLDKVNNSDSIVNLNIFDEQMEMLKDEGFTTLFYQDIIDFVENGSSIPDKPILITFDDGYSSNLTHVLPVLKKHGMCATISVIGCSMGRSIYKDTNTSIIPHFSFYELNELNCQEYIDIQSHSYDMHKVYSLDSKDYRFGVSQNKEESIIEYIANLSDDFMRSRQDIESQTNKTVNVFTYPFGEHSDLSEQILRYNGAKVTVTTNNGINKITYGDPDSLYRLKRINVHSNYSAIDLLNLLNSFIYDSN